MKQIIEDDFSIMPENQPFTLGDLKAIHNVIMESGVPDGWITGQAILGKIELVLNPTN
jgi:hypothetical protein